MADNASKEQTCICLDPRAQYSALENNIFVDVNDAVKSYDTNNRIEDNSLTSSSLIAVGSGFN